jgi:transcriptional regulator with XRE-family HTH domain
MRGTLAGRVRHLRERQGWTQEHLAVEAHLSTRTIQRIERGEPGVGPTALGAVAEALKCDVAALRTGFTAESLAAFEQEYFCPHCGAPMEAPTPVPLEHADDEIEVFACGFTRGYIERPCPKDSRFPKFEDYELIPFCEDTRHYCQAQGKTAFARQVSLQTGFGDTPEEATAWVKYFYISVRDGFQAAQAFLPRPGPT